MAAPIPVFAGVVGADGLVHLEAKQMFDRYVSRLKGQRIKVTVRKEARPKSHNQLGYLWGVVYPVIAEEFGYHDTELDALHDAVIRELRGLRPDPNPLGLRVSLADMPHEEVSRYISDVRFWALTNHGIVTPDATSAEAA